MPEVVELLSLDYWRDHVMAIAYAGAGLLLFIVFTIGTFPYDRALTSALVPLGLKVSYNAEHPAFPVGAVLEDVRLVSLDQPGASPLVQSEALKLTPGLGTLIGRPGVGINADIYGGNARATVRRAGDSTNLAFSLTDIDLARYPMSPQYGVNLKGVVSGGGNFAIINRALTSQVGDLNLDGHDLDFGLGRGMPAVKFSNVKGSFTVDHATLRINALEASGPDLALSGSGVIHLGPTLAGSIMQLTLRITPTMAGRAKLGVLFAFLPHPPDNRPYILRGPVLTPSIS
jgi:type II secretion system protein N